MLVLFSILALGSWLGQLSVRRVSLGSAGVFFVALVFGHFGFTVPKAIMELGLLLFVYAVGLQAGPSFFRTFRRQGSQFAIIGIVTVTAGALATVVIARGMRLPYDLAAGLFTGALTNTPALAAAVDAVSRIDPQRSATVAVGYGIAYPFSLIGIVLLVQALPAMLRRDVRAEEKRWLQSQQAERLALQVKQYLISNPNCEGKLLRELNPHRMSRVNISRVRQGDRVFAATPEVVLHQGDIVMVVGPEDELAKMRLLLGEETQVPMDVNTNVASVDVEVTESSLVGKTLASLKVWERYTVVITRIRRQGIEITPAGSSTLEMGDTLRVVGERSSVAQFVQLASRDSRRVDETNMVPFLIGLVLGILLGAIPFRLPNGMVLKLGAAGGAFLVSLLVGHFGHIGPFRMYVPPAARNLSRELGLMLFLAGAGTTAGAPLWSVVRQQGFSLFLAGAAITIVAVIAGLTVMLKVYRMDILGTLGALCAGMTNPPGLAAANAQAETDLPALIYASIFPVALIFKIIMAQVLVTVLSG